MSDNHRHRGSLRDVVILLKRAIKKIKTFEVKDGSVRMETSELNFTYKPKDDDEVKEKKDD